jgi:hypothetical protein
MKVPVCHGRNNEVYAAPIIKRALGQNTAAPMQMRNSVVGNLGSPVFWYPDFLWTRRVGVAPALAGRPIFPPGVASRGLPSGPSRAGVEHTGRHRAGRPRHRPYRKPPPILRPSAMQASGRRDLGSTRPEISAYPTRIDPPLCVGGNGKPPHQVDPPAVPLARDRVGRFADAARGCYRACGACRGSCLLP